MLERAEATTKEFMRKLETMRTQGLPVPETQTLTRLLSRCAKDRISEIKGHYRLPPEQIEANVDEILFIEAEQEKCKGCMGLCSKTGSNAGMIPRVNDENGRFYTTYAPCKYARGEQIKARIERLCVAAKVPARYKDTGFDDYEITENNRIAVNMARMMVRADEGGLFFHGPKGTGKTMLAAIVANERAKSGKGVLFSSVPDLLRDIRATFDSGNTETVTRTVQNAPLLVLDDLGAENMTSWVGEQLFSIINHRYNENMPTVITSNYSGGMLVEHLRDPKNGSTTNGERIVSRINGWCMPVKMGGKDRREGQAAAKILLFPEKSTGGIMPDTERR